jgi:hypothetical protein
VVPPVVGGSIGDASSRSGPVTVCIPSTEVSAATLLSRHVLPAWVALTADADERTRLSVALSLHHVAGALGHEAAAVVVAPVAAALLADASAAVSSALVSTAAVWLPAVSEPDLQRRVQSLAAVVPALLRASSRRRGAAWRTDVAALEALRLIPLLYPAAPACDAALSVTLAGVDACAPVRAAAIHSLVWWARHAPSGRARAAVADKLRAIFAPARRTLDAVREHLGSCRVKGRGGGAFVLLPVVVLPAVDQGAADGGGEEMGGGAVVQGLIAAVVTAPAPAPSTLPASPPSLSSAALASAPAPAPPPAPVPAQSTTTTPPLILSTEIATSAICAARLPKCVTDASGLAGRSTLFGPAWRRALVVDALGAALWLFSRKRVVADFLPPVVEAARYDPAPPVRLAAVRALPFLRGWLLLPHDADALGSIVSTLVSCTADADERVSKCARCGLEKLARVNAAISASFGGAAQDPSRAAMLSSVLLALPGDAGDLLTATANASHANALLLSTSRSRAGSTEGSGTAVAAPSAAGNTGVPVLPRSRSPGPPLPPSMTTAPTADASASSDSTAGGGKLGGGRVKPAMSIATLGHVAMLGHAAARRVHTRQSADAAAQNAANSATASGGGSGGLVGAVTSAETAQVPAPAGKVFSAPPTPVGPTRKSAPLVSLPASPMMLPNISCPSPSSSSLAPHLKEAVGFGGGVGGVDTPTRLRFRAQATDSFAEDATAVAAVVLARDTDFFAAAGGALGGEAGVGGSCFADGLDAVTSASPFFRNPFRSIVTEPLGAAAVGDISVGPSGIHASLVPLDSLPGFCGGGGDALSALWSGVSSNLDAPLSSLLTPGQAPRVCEKVGERVGVVAASRPLPATSAAAVGAAPTGSGDSGSVQSLPALPTTMHYSPPTFASLVSVIEKPFLETAEPDAAAFKGRLCADNLGDFFRVGDGSTPSPPSPAHGVVTGVQASIAWTPSTTPRPPPRPATHALLAITPAAHSSEMETARISAEAALLEAARTEEDDARLRFLRLSDAAHDGGGADAGAGGVSALDCEGDDALLSAWPFAWRAALHPLSLAARKAAQTQPHALLTVSTQDGGGRRDIAVALSPFFAPLSSRIPPPPSVPGAVAVEGFAFLASAKALSGCVVVDVFAERDRTATADSAQAGGVQIADGPVAPAASASMPLSPILSPALDALPAAGPRLTPFSATSFSSVATPTGLEILSASLVAYLLQGVARSAAIPGSPLAVAAAAAAVSLEESSRVMPTLAPLGGEGDGTSGDAAAAAADALAVLSTRSVSVDPASSASAASGMSSSGSARWGGSDAGGAGRTRAASLVGHTRALGISDAASPLFSSLTPSALSLPVASLQGSHGASAQPVSLSLRGAQLSSLSLGPSSATAPSTTTTVRAPLRGLAGSVVSDASVGTVTGGLPRGARALRSQPPTSSPQRDSTTK